MRQLIGRFGVDSGQAMVGDPCYLESWGQDNEFNYDKACDVTIKNKFGVLSHGMSVVFETGYGDGAYPVYAELNEDGRVARITIDFIGDLELEDEN